MADAKLALAALEAAGSDDPVAIALSCHVSASEQRFDDLRGFLRKIAEGDPSLLGPFFDALLKLGGMRRIAGILHRDGVHRTGGPLSGLLGLFHQTIYIRGWTVTKPWPLDNSRMLEPVQDRMPQACRDLVRRINETGQGMGEPTPRVGGEVPWDDGTVLFNLVAQTRPRRILEIGFAKGMSTLFMLSASDSIESHTVIDPLQGSAYRHNGVKNVTQAGYGDKLRLIEMPSSLAMPMLLADGETFDLIFIDGSHCFEHTIMEALFADLLAEPDTLVAYHDYHMQPVYAALEFMRSNRGWSGVLASDVVIMRRDRAQANMQDNYTPFATARGKS
ncbi:MAG: class I SAM-dependent methyltransferase [Alphaproteobacteria bacterium]|nr:class I SAM-dependent methyltransferase [Alphaproteobacteria bacterium]MBF0332050.1 class I SAM-dependent methyltransferase [Alphaproteobacteria bacterium]